MNALGADLVGEPSAYALVGMAAVMAATCRAPLTALAFIAELTGNPDIVLPLLITCGIASVGTDKLDEMMFMSSSGMMMLNARNKKSSSSHAGGGSEKIFGGRYKEGPSAVTSVTDLEYGLLDLRAADMATTPGVLLLRSDVPFKQVANIMVGKRGGMRLRGMIDMSFTMISNHFEK